MKKISLDVLTAQQFKTLLEQFTADGKVNTIPELMERIGEVPDDMTLEDFIKQKAEQSAIDEETVRRVVEEQMTEEQADHGDIDEIFTDTPDGSGDDTPDSPEDPSGDTVDDI